jgi:L-fuconolactonase
MTTDHEAWLRLTTEDPLYPDIPICDAHHHLWDNPDDRYLADELLQDIRGEHNVVQTVFVQSKRNIKSRYRKSGPREVRPVGETEFIESTTAWTVVGQKGTTRVAAAIVGIADLTLGNAVSPALEAHVTAGKNRFRGVRYPTMWDANPDVLPNSDAPRQVMDAKFREGFAYLKNYGLSFDAWQFYPQLIELVDLARAYPEVQIIINHTGGPLGIGPYAGRRNEIFQEWKRLMREAASCPNIAVKLGGLGMPLYSFGWNEQTKPPSSTQLADGMEPYYFHASNCLGQRGVCLKATSLSTRFRIRTPFCGTPSSGLPNTSHQERKQLCFTILL